MRRSPAAFALAAAVAFAVRSAHADPPAPAPPPAIDPADRLPGDAPPPKAAPPPETHIAWYGYETLLTDTLSGAVAIVATSNGGSASVGFLAALAYLAGGPIVHAETGQPLRAGISLGLRVALPLLGAAIGVAAHSRPQPPSCCYPPDPDWGGLAAAAEGFMVGVGAAAVLDAAALAYKHVPDEPPAPRKAAVSVSPQVSVDPRGGVRAGIGGTF
jgi:hypothetical protein